MLAFEAWMIKEAATSGGMRATWQRERRFARYIARMALRSLYAELCLYPKPGLVSRIDNGSHDDMTAATFMRSLFSLRHYFAHITQAGMQGQPFAALRQLGMVAEQRMLAATRGINTHRGAIFCLGLLCAAIGHCQAQGHALSPTAIRNALVLQYGVSLSAHTRACDGRSNGARVVAQHATSGAREEAASGMASVFEVALPVLRDSVAAGRDYDCACIDALFTLMTRISDTNIYHRGGAHGAAVVKACATDFLQRGATAAPTWKQHALACHRVFMRRRLSPGGAADLLAATVLIDRVTRGDSDWT